MLKTSVAIIALMLLAGCKQAANDIGNAANTSVQAAGNAADHLADRTDDWGNRASSRIDNASAADQARVGRLNERMGRLADPGIPTDLWVGRWRGVEGLTLVIAKDVTKGPGHYTLT